MSTPLRSSQSVLKAALKHPRPHSPCSPIQSRTFASLASASSIPTAHPSSKKPFQTPDEIPMLLIYDAPSWSATPKSYPLSPGSFSFPSLSPTRPTSTGTFYLPPSQSSTWNGKEMERDDTAIVWFAGPSRPGPPPSTLRH